MRVGSARESTNRTQELAALVEHATQSPGRSSTDCGIVRPSAFAVLRSITSSNFVGCSTGRVVHR